MDFIFRFALLSIATLFLLSGCGTGETGSPQTSSNPIKSHFLSRVEAQKAIQSLPYTVRFSHVAAPKGATSALAGRAVGSGRTVVNFGVSLGNHPEPVSVPHAGTADWTSFPTGGFVYTDDLQVRGPDREWKPGPQFKTAAQEREAVRMNVEMREALCKQATGAPCPIGE